MFKKMKLGTKLLIAFLAVGVIPLAITATLSLNKSSAALTQLAFNQLEGYVRSKNRKLNSFCTYSVSSPTHAACGLLLLPEGS